MQRVSWIQQYILADLQERIVEIWIELTPYCIIAF